MGNFLSAIRAAHSTQAGFTLYQAIITMGIISVAMLGVVGVQELIEQNQLQVYSNLLIENLNLARHEAIKRQHPVTLCKSNNGTQCVRSAAWQSGWIVFADTDGNRKVDSKETVIHVEQLSAPNLSLRYGETGTYYYVTYYPTGFASPNATFILCRKQNAKNAKGVIVHWTGRARITHKKSDGSPLKCTKS